MNDEIKAPANEVLKSDEVQGIITLVIIFLLGFFSIFATAWWVRVVGWVVMGLTALSAYHIGKGITKRIKEDSVELNKENDVNNGK